MTSSGTPPSQSLINAAIQSCFPEAVGGALGVGTVVVGVAGSVGVISGVAIGAPGAITAASTLSGGLSLVPVNVVDVYYSSLIPAISINGHSIPRQSLKGPLAVDTSCLAPEFNHDFTDIRDTGKTFSRGNQPYERPCGSYRIALKVKDKFDTDNVWLGMKGDEPSEWPVSYHGTAQHNALSIAEEGFQLSKGKRFLFGKGIYSTPELAVAKHYASSFAHEGTSYKCIIQNRVNPKYLKVIPKAQNGIGTYWLSAADVYVNETEFIRPYGVCLFTEGSNCTFA